MCGDMESSWTKFKELLLKLECKFIPIKRIDGNGRIKEPVWMTRKALRCVRKKKSVFRKYRDKGHPAVKRANLEATNELRKEISG